MAPLIIQTLLHTSTSATRKPPNKISNGPRIYEAVDLIAVQCMNIETTRNGSRNEHLGRIFNYDSVTALVDELNLWL